MNCQSKIIIFLTGKKLFGKTLLVFNDEKLIGRLKISRRTLIFRYFWKSISLEYLTLNPSIIKKIKIIGLQFYKNFKQNGFKFLYVFVFGYKIPISLDGNIGYLSFNIEEDSRSTWVSRAALNYGVKPYSLNHSIEYDFSRFPNTFSAFIWGLKILSVKKFGKVTKNLKTRLEFAEVNISEKVKNGALMFHDLDRCHIFQGKTIVHKNKIYPIDLYNYTDNSWPSDSVVQIDSKLIIIKSVSKTNYYKQPSIYFGSSTSWFHFLVEVFPRYLHYGPDKIKNLSVVIEHNVPTQILQTIRLLSDKLPICLFPFESVVFDKLTVCIETRFLKGLDLPSRASDLCLVRDYFRTVFPITNIENGRKIFLIRKKSLFRYSEKVELISKFCHDYDFEIIDTTDLSMAEQVYLFSKAEIVIGETGSALTNLLFCRNDCKVIEINLNNFMPGFFKEFTNALDLNHRSIEKVYFKSGKLMVSSEGDNLALESLIT